MIKYVQVVHDEISLVGTVKSCGCKRPLEDSELVDEWVVADWQRFEPADKPIYRIQPKVKERKDKIEEKGITLESIWSPKEADNVSDGQCSNAQISVIYTHDFSDEWNVHITCDIDDVFHRLETPSNSPPHRECNEDDAEDRKISLRLFDVTYFQAYCQAKVISEARRTKLEILTLEEGKVRQAAYLERQREEQERIANDEEYEDEDFEPLEDEDEDFEEA